MRSVQLFKLTHNGDIGEVAFWVLSNRQRTELAQKVGYGSVGSRNLVAIGFTLTRARPTSSRRLLALHHKYAYVHPRVLLAYISSSVSHPHSHTKTHPHTHTHTPPLSPPLSLTLLLSRPSFCGLPSSLFSLLPPPFLALLRFTLDIALSLTSSLRP